MSNYIPPNTTAAPNLYYDLLISFLTSDERGIYGYVVRQVNGWEINRIAGCALITTEDFVHGRTDDEGNHYDYGAGASQGAVSPATKFLIKIGALIVVDNPPKQITRGRRGTVWALEYDKENIDTDTLFERHNRKKEAGRKRTQKARLKRKVTVPQNDKLLSDNTYDYSPTERQVTVPQNDKLQSRSNDTIYKKETLERKEERKDSPSKLPGIKNGQLPGFENYKPYNPGLSIQENVRGFQELGIDMAERQLMINEMLTSFGKLALSKTQGASGEKVLTRFQENTLTLAEMGYTSHSMIKELIENYRQPERLGGHWSAKKDKIGTTNQLLEYASQQLTAQVQENDYGYSNSTNGNWQHSGADSGDGNTIAVGQPFALGADDHKYPF